MKAVIQLCITAVLILLVCCTAELSFILLVIPGIWGLVEGILILTGHISKDAKGNSLKSE